MAKRKCPECDLSFANGPRFESHRILHSSIAVDDDGEIVQDDALNAATGLIDAATGTPTAIAPDPTIDPFDLPPVPDFDTGTGYDGGAGPSSYPVPPPESAAVPVTLLTADTLAAVLKSLFETTAELFDTGIGGTLSDREASLIATLSLGWVNQQLTASGADGNQMMLYAAVGLIGVSKFKIYAAAWKRKRGAPKPKPTQKAPDVPVTSEGADPVPAGLAF